MSNSIVDIAGWVEAAKSDPIQHLERQSTEIILTAMGTLPAIGEKVFLKGGVLMGVMHHSPRQTTDIDLTTTLEAYPDIDKVVRDALDDAMPRAAARLGYPDIVLKVQSIAKRPRNDGAIFAAADFPALLMKIGYAKRGTKQESLVASRQCPNVIEIDISFNEPVCQIDIIQLGEGGANIRVYSLVELIAEKLRAQLQQPIRNRKRPQDLYDIALLLEQNSLSLEDKQNLLANFIEKCRSRNIEPNADSLSDPAVVDRAKADWDDMKVELGDIPLFEKCFEKVDVFYRELWSLAKGKAT